jgi:hypothetical protein
MPKENCICKYPFSLFLAIQQQTFSSMYALLSSLLRLADSDKNDLAT